jgi:hypothetical protein
MAYTFTREILEKLRKKTECSKFGRWGSADKKAVDYYKKGYITALDEIEYRLDQRKKEWKNGLSFEGYYSSVGDFMGEHKLEAVGEALFGKGWLETMNYYDEDAIQNICNLLYPFRYSVTCLDLGEKDIEIIENVI